MTAQVLSNIVVIVVTLGISVYIAFKCTPDLSHSENRTLYRLALCSFIWRGLAFMCESLGVLKRL